MPSAEARLERPPHDFSLPLGGGLALRLRERQHVPEFHALIVANAAHLAPWFDFARRPSLETAEAITVGGLGRFAAGDGWEADLLEWSEPVGAMKLHHMDGPGGSTEVGYWLAAAAQGRGLITRALRGLLPHLFVGHALGRVAIACDPRNERSAAVPARLGFQPEAVLRRAATLDDEPYDLAFYGLLREEWEALGGAPDAGARPPRFGMPLGDGLELVLLERGDARAANELVVKNLARLDPWMPWTSDLSLEAQLGFITGRALPAIRDQDGFECGLYLGARLVGMVGVHGVSKHGRRGSIGYWLDGEFEGRGLVARAVGGVLARCFLSGACGGVPFERIDIRADVENARSRAVPERLGFGFDGVLRREFFSGERYVDTAVYSMLRSEWLQRHGGG